MWLAELCYGIPAWISFFRHRYHHMLVLQFLCVPIACIIICVYRMDVSQFLCVPHAYIIFSICILYDFSLYLETWFLFVFCMLISVYFVPWFLSVWWFCMMISVFQTTRRWLSLFPRSIFLFVLYMMISMFQTTRRWLSLFTRSGWRGRRTCAFRGSCRWRWSGERPSAGTSQRASLVWKWMMKGTLHDMNRYAADGWFRQYNILQKL